VKKKILHVLTDLPEKYNSKFVQFASGSLGQFEHLFCPVSVSGDLKEISKLPGVEIYEPEVLSKRRRFFSLLRILRSNDFDLVVIHGFFFGGWRLFVLTLWFQIFKFPHKALWMTWGGDTYHFQNSQIGVARHISHFLRRLALRHVPFVAAATPQEEDVLRFYYTPRAKFFAIFYPLPLAAQATVAKKNEAASSSFVALIGNSADPSNRHDSIFDLIEQSALSMDLYVPLAYGDTAYGKKIAAIGKKRFGPRFTPQLEMLSPSNYEKVLDKIDFGVFFHNRQQGLGNILFLLAQGKPVFMRSDTLSYEYMKSMGWAVHDVRTLKEIDSDVMNRLIAEAQSPLLTQAVASHFSEEKAATLWNRALSMMLARAVKIK